MQLFEYILKLVNFFQAIWSIVKKRNMATTYSDVKNSPKFGHFIRAVIGLPYAPLDRLEEAMRVLEKIAKTNIVQRKFCHQMLQYLWKTWLDGNIPRRVWNMYQHQGVKTNNHAEAFNFKMGSKKRISKHPNPYVLAEEMKAHLKEGCDTAIAETITSHKKKVDPKVKQLREKKKGLMKELSKRNIDLETYLASMGANTLKYQPRIQKDNDPLADDNIFSDNENEEVIEAFNEIRNEELNHETLQQIPVTEKTPTSKDKTPKSRKNHNKKGKRKKQKPLPGSEESFVHVESLADHDAPQHASVGGADLRMIRREEEEETINTASILTAATVASAGISIMSRFISRSSASRSPRRLSTGHRSPRPHPGGSRSTAPSSPSASDQCTSAKQRVESLGFRFSSSQPFTRGDGNCMLYALFDQLQKCNHPILQNLKSSHDLRLYVCSKLMEQIESNNIFWVQNFSPQSWLDKMRCNSYWCDDVFLQIFANIFNKHVILIPLNPSSAHHAGMYQDIRAIGGGEGDPFFMLYFEEWKTAGHYQSLEQDPNTRYNMVLAHFDWRSKALQNSSCSTSTNSHQATTTPPPCPTPTPSAPSSLSRACPRSPPPPPSEPLQSTRQRLESDSMVSFSRIISPIHNSDRQCERSAPSTNNTKGMYILFNS